LAGLAVDVLTPFGSDKSDFIVPSLCEEKHNFVQENLPSLFRSAPPVRP